MLSEDIKTEIQSAYSRLLSSKGFKSRYCQKVMIAEIARNLSQNFVEKGAAEKSPAEKGAAEKNSPEKSPPEKNKTRSEASPEDPLADSLLDQGNVCVIEAGTGTGKTIAYVLAAMRLAQAREKKLVIATATVALQEQIVYQDLPDIQRHAGMDFSFTLAKGRRRYLCLSRLESALQGSEAMNSSFDFYDAHPGNDEKSDVKKGSHKKSDAKKGSLPQSTQSRIPLFERMRKKLDRGDWDGDRDSWQTEVDQQAWQAVSTDYAQCTGKQCSHYENCCFYRARENIHRVKCVVTNHDLVLADQVMGDGGILPAPEDAIYIFDEGHHLPEKARGHLSLFIALYATRNWLPQALLSVKQLADELDLITPASLLEVEEDTAHAGTLLDGVAQMLTAFYEQATPDGDRPSNNRGDRRSNNRGNNRNGNRRYLFPLGLVPEELMTICGESAGAFNNLLTNIKKIARTLQTRLDDKAAEQREVTEHGLSVVSSIGERVAAAAALWNNFALSDDEQGPPWARWVSFNTEGAAEGMEVQLSASPISVADALQAGLWSRSCGALITSATLSLAGDFSRLRNQLGLAEASPCVTLPSPFNFLEQGCLRIPKMEAEPNRPQEHDQNITRLLPDLLADEPGSLVLFTSRRQMLAVMDALDAGFQQRVLCQDSYSKMEILERHKQAVDAGQPSCIFGLASFAEGIDLPGGYCTHVVLARIPFAVPDDPVTATLSAWINARGGNAFMEVSLPDAILKMVQACGRLLRTETDHGSVTVLDRRLVTKRYGQTILRALPPFKREID